MGYRNGSGPVSQESLNMNNIGEESMRLRELRHLLQQLVESLKVSLAALKTHARPTAEKVQIAQSLQEVGNVYIYIFCSAALLPPPLSHAPFSLLVVDYTTFYAYFHSPSPAAFAHEK